LNPFQLSFIYLRLRAGTIRGIFGMRRALSSTRSAHATVGFKELWCTGGAAESTTAAKKRLVGVPIRARTD